MPKRKEVKEEEEKYIRWFSEIGKEDVKDVGGKAANLGEMMKMGMPVPPGFVITAEAYSYFLLSSELDEKIYDMLKKIDVENTSVLEETAKKIREFIERAEMPEDLEKEISEAYKLLSIDKESMGRASELASSILKMSDPAFVAVRSSATAEDTAKASFAGQQETFLNVKGIGNILDSVKKCFASLFTARSIYYRVKKGFRHEDVLNAAVVQIMIASDKSGVIFSRDPVNKEENVVIEAVFGLGEGIVSGKIKPDYYLIS
ncbi:MAG: PEP/pyruvate-binding domain-containing protein, partial [Nanoarchaeota archaeon]